MRCLVQQEGLGTGGDEGGVVEWRGSQGWRSSSPGRSALPGAPLALAARPLCLSHPGAALDPPLK